MNSKVLISISSDDFSCGNIKRLAVNLSDSKDKYLQKVGFFIEQWLSSNSHIDIFTSGSTGKPKKIQIQKKMMIVSAQATISYFKLTKGIKALHCLPIDFIAGKMMLIRAILGKWHLDIVLPSSTPLQSIAENKKYDFSAMIPLQVQHSLDKLSCINKLIIGGASISDSLEKQLKNIPTKCYETYGMTETITHIAVRELNNSKFFQTLNQIFIDFDDRGCLVIKSTRISEMPIITNDIVKIHNSNTFEYLGRWDNMINSGGLKIFPEEVERRIQHLIPYPFFAVGLKDLVLGKKLILFIETSWIDKEALLNQIKKILPKNKCPKDIVCMPHFVYSSSLKIKIKDTLQMHLNKG